MGHGRAHLVLLVYKPIVGWLSLGIRE